jgi:cohesin loading factor subunit SCC2
VEDGSPLAIAGTNKQASARDTAEIEARAIDQQQKSQASLKALQGLMNDAFEVEDQMQGDTSGKVLTASTEIFENATGQDGSTATLTPGMLIKLDAALLKVISDHKFPELAVDDLSRLQRLCDGSLRAAESVDLKFQDDWSEDDYSRWEERIEVASTGLKAGRTMMRIMTGGREEKVLSSEEMINSILNVLKNVIDSFMIPIVELRSSGSRSEVFKTVSTRFKIITALFNQASRLLRLLVDLLGKEEVTEGVITTAEFLACGLIFVENSHSDKDSVIGVQKFERFRVLAMDVLTQIFSRYPDQRTFVFDEILTSLERLPVTRQAARHFKLTEGGNIQLVSALILKLVQTSAMRSSASTSQKKGRRLLGAVLEDGETAEADVEPDADGEADEDEDTEEQAKQLPERAMRRLSILCEPLSDTTKKNAQYVIQFLVSRALRSTKTGDDPYRVLLDIFTEDLITVLSSPEWPAAELLLRLLLTSMIGIAEGEKSAAPAKNMALDLMGLMGSAISDLVGHMRQSSKLLEHRADGLDGLLGHLTEKYLEGQVHDKDLSVWNGPYRATLQFCQQRVVDDNQIESSQGYYMTQWASRVCAAYEASDEETSEERARRKSGRLAFRLRRMVLDTKWLEAER